MLIKIIDSLPHFEIQTWDNFPWEYPFWYLWYQLWDEDTYRKFRKLRPSYPFFIWVSLSLAGYEFLWFSAWHVGTSWNTNGHFIPLEMTMALSPRKDRITRDHKIVDRKGDKGTIIGCHATSAKNLAITNSSYGN